MAVVTTVMLTPELHHELRKESFRLNKSMSKIVREALEIYFNEDKPRREVNNNE